MIKKSTYIFGFFTLLVLVLVRENKNKETKAYEVKFKAEQRIQKQKNTISLLLQNQETQIEKIKLEKIKNDSLLIANKLHEERTKQLKQSKSYEETRSIINAPDTTILRILSEHNIKTNDNK